MVKTSQWFYGALTLEISEEESRKNKGVGADSAQKVKRGGEAQQPGPPRGEVGTTPQETECPETLPRVPP